MAPKAPEKKRRQKRQKKMAPKAPEMAPKAPKMGTRVNLMVANFLLPWPHFDGNVCLRFNDDILSKI
jgi:hypothetical protein